MPALKMPDVTKAQILALVVAVCAQAVGAGLISDETSKAIVQIGGLAVPLIWILADAIIRLGRAPVAVAQVEARAKVEAAKSAAQVPKASPKPRPRRKS